MSRVVHIQMQAADPQTLAYGLTDSPVGLLAYLTDRRRWWSDSAHHAENVFSRDDLLTLATIYWVNDPVSTLRYYYEAGHDLWRPSHDRQPPVEPPTALVVSPQELVIFPKAFVKRWFNLQRLTYLDAGGHFAPAEQPEAIVEDLRAFFSELRV
jgi:pimeloyl-ACP methyl ester carboxylesterase